MIADWASIFTRWQTWALMANQDIQLRYRRSVLGPFWISIALATLVFSIGLLYSQVQHQPFEEFLTFFGCGMVAWTFLLGMISDGCSVIIDSEAHLRNLRLPTPLLAARVVYRNTIVLLHNLLVIGIMLAIFGRAPDWTGLLAIPGLLLYIPIGLFFAIAIGPICARFRDLPQVISSVMQVAFFMTPIFWIPGSNLDRHVAVMGNPFYHLIEIVRRPLMGDPATAMNWYVSLIALGTVLLLAMISLAVTRKRIFLWL